LYLNTFLMSTPVMAQKSEIVSGWRKHIVLMHSYPQSVPSSTELLISRSNSSHFLPGFKYHYPQQVSWSEDEQQHVSFPEIAKLISKNTCVCRWYCFCTWCYYTANSDQPFIATDAVAHFVSVVLTCPLSLQTSNTLWKWRWCC